MKQSLKGYLLVAAPSLVTPFFTRTVILMLEHNEEGAMGLVVNRPTEATVAQVAEQVFDDELPWEKPIHLGGPVPGPLQVVHTLEHLADQTVLDGVYSSLEPSKVEALLRAREEPVIVVANYSGWGPGQLESEMAEDSWLIWPASEDLVFTDDLPGLWDLVVRRIRNNQLSEMFGVATVPEDPGMN